jgi:hypothetical protein
MGILRPRDSTSIYQKVLPGITLNQCAVQCKNESEFHCSSLDFIFTSTFFGECRLSVFVAASVGGLVVDSTQPPQNHYELAGKYTHKRQQVLTCVRLPTQCYFLTSLILFCCKRIGEAHFTKLYQMA